MNEELQQKIQEKQDEIAHYVGVLERLRHNRWYHTGLDHMAELKAELVELEKLT